MPNAQNSEENIKENIKNNHSVDELQKFNQLASRFWDPKAELKTLHQINPLRLKFILEILGTPDLSHQNGLDIGCGGGILTEALAKQNAQMTGIDLASEVIQVAKLHLFESGLNINYQQISVETLASENTYQNYFDFITCMEMLEHVPDPESIILNAAKLIKPNGFIFFSTINKNLRSFIEVILGAEYILKILPKGTHHYEKFIRPENLIAMARQANLSPIKASDLIYHPIQQSFEIRHRPGKPLGSNYLIGFKKIKK